MVRSPWVFMLGTVLAVSVQAQEKSAGKSAPLILIEKGGLPIVLSAPHGGQAAIPNAEPRKGGAELHRFVNVPDANTDRLANLISQHLEKTLGGKPFMVQARFHRKYLDVNRLPADAYECAAAQKVYESYHQALADAVKEVRSCFGNGLLIDVHGQKTFPDKLLRGTQNGKTATLARQRFGAAAFDGANSIFGNMEARGYKVFPLGGSTEKEEPRYGGGHIVQAYGSHHGEGIDAFQMEFGADLRADGVIAQTAKDAAESIAVYYRSYLKSPQAKPVLIR